MSTRILSLATTVLLIQAACSDQPRRPLDETELGILQQSTPYLDSAHLLIASGLDTKHFLEWVFDATTLSDGTILLADGGLNQLLQYDEHGTFLRQRHIS